jgi:hypothetical protein
VSMGLSLIYSKISYANLAIIDRNTKSILKICCIEDFLLPLQPVLTRINLEP